jgi:hypothetical protein
MTDRFPLFPPATSATALIMLGFLPFSRRDGQLRVAYEKCQKPLSLQ